MADKAGSVAKVKVVPNAGPGRVGFAVDRADGRFKVRRGGTVRTESLSIDGVLNQTTAAVTLLAKDDGLSVQANAAATVTVTLPLALPGMQFRVLVGQLPGSGAGTTLAPNAADKFQGNGFNAKTAGQTIVNSAATDAVGDLLDVQCYTAGIWYVVNKIGTWV